MAAIGNSREALVSDIQAVEDGWSTILAGLSNEQANKQPMPGRWSIAQNLSHINIAARLYSEQILKVLKQTREQGLKSRRGTLIGKLMVYAVSPPSRFKVKAPKMVLPEENINVSTAYTEFVKLNEQLRQILGEYSESELNAARLSSPLIKAVKVSGLQAVQILLAHAQRHLYQVRLIGKLN